MVVVDVGTGLEDSVIVLVPCDVVRVAEAVPVALPVALPVVLPLPLMWNRLEYWNTVVSLATSMTRPYTALSPRAELIFHS